VLWRANLVAKEPEPTNPTPQLLMVRQKWTWVFLHGMWCVLTCCKCVWCLLRMHKQHVVKIMGVYVYKMLSCFGYVFVLVCIVNFFPAYIAFSLCEYCNIFCTHRWQNSDFVACIKNWLGILGMLQHLYLSNM
jgi:hypothetical protein